MAIAHKDITDPNNHEPKGISTASNGHVYVSTGAGTGAWQFPKLSGQAAAVSGAIPISTGGGNVTWQLTPASSPSYAEMDNPEVVRSLTGSTEVQLNSFVFNDVTASKFTLTGGTSLTVLESGTYLVNISVQVKPQSALGANNEVIEARFLTNGATPTPYRIVPISVTRNSAVDDPFTIVFTRIVNFTAGDVNTVTLKNLAATRSYKVLANINMVRIA